jgi:hypothetical protein
MKKGDCSQPQLITPSWPPPAGHPQLATPLFLSLYDILKKSKEIIEIEEKILRKNVTLIKTMKKGTAANPHWPPLASHTQLAIFSWAPHSSFLPMISSFLPKIF